MKMDLCSFKHDMSKKGKCEGEREATRSRLLHLDHPELKMEKALQKAKSRREPVHLEKRSNHRDNGN